MDRSSLPLTLVCMLLLTAPAAAQTAPAPVTPAPRVAKPAPRAAGPVTTTSRKPSPRMLEDILIEGEIPVPQVLFVTARDQRRFLTSSHRRYLATSLQLGQSTLLPSGVVVTRTPGEPAKETPR